MSEANREAVERMFSKVIAAARKVGLSDDEIRIIVDVELLGGESVLAEKKPATVAPRIEDVVVPHRPGDTPRTDAEIIPELEGPVPSTDTQGEPVRLPLGLENLFQIKVPPRRIKAPPKSSWDKYAIGEGPTPGGPPGEPDGS